MDILKYIKRDDKANAAQHKRALSRLQNDPNYDPLLPSNIQEAITESDDAAIALLAVTLRQVDTIAVDHQIRRITYQYWYDYLVSIS